MHISYAKNERMLKKKKDSEQLFESFLTIQYFQELT
jgi:hypothetical protein